MRRGEMVEDDFEDRVEFPSILQHLAHRFLRHAFPTFPSFGFVVTNRIRLIVRIEVVQIQSLVVVIITRILILIFRRRSIDNIPHANLGDLLRLSEGLLILVPLVGLPLNLDVDVQGSFDHETEDVLREGGAVLRYCEEVVDVADLRKSRFPFRGEVKDEERREGRGEGRDEGKEHAQEGVQAPVEDSSGH